MASQHDMPQPGRVDWVRRLAFPVLILIVAMALYLWSNEQRIADREAAAAWVLDLAREVAAGDADSVAGAREAFASPLTLEKTREVLADAEPDEVTVTIQADDIAPPYGDGTATHVATLSIDDDKRLALRVQYDATDPQRSRIIGHVVLEDGAPRP